MKRNKTGNGAFGTKAVFLLAMLAATLVFGLVLAGCASGPPIPKVPLPQIPAGQPYKVSRAFPRSALLADNKAVSFRVIDNRSKGWQNFLLMDTPFVALGQWADEVKDAKQALEGKLEVLNQMLAAEWAANFGAEMTFTTENFYQLSSAEKPFVYITVSPKKVLAMAMNTESNIFWG